MTESSFYHPIEIRYADIDAQRHVNNARYFMYMEQARAKFVQAVGLWSGEDFDAIGFILAEQSCTYNAPIMYRHRIHIGVRTARLGRKSFELAYSFQDQETGQELATGRTVLVAYDYQAAQSVQLPDSWRNVLEAHLKSDTT